MEIVVHRALWSGVILLGLVTLVPSLFGGLKDARAALATPRMRLGFLVTCALLSVNWIVFVYAVQARQVFDAALGYFIYPLVTVVLGILVLRERLDRWGWAAVGIVGCGVALKAVHHGGVPWIALVLALSFALYGVTRKRMTVNPVIGMFVETVFLIPLSVIYLAWRHDAGQTIFFGGGAVNVTLAVFAGVVTVVPLLLYHAGNRALPISVASLLFYINPTTQLVVGLVYFDLVAAPEEWLVFGLIWTGLALYFASRRRCGASVNHAR
jgi:chloramphenicol-sensitive protein RarD